MLKFDSCSSCAPITGSLFSIKADDVSLPRYWLNCVSKIGLSNIQHQYISTVWWKKTGRRVLNWTTIRLPLTQSSCLTNLCVSTREQPSLESSIYWVQRRGHFCWVRASGIQTARVQLSNELVGEMLQQTQYSTSPLPPLCVFLPQPSQYLDVLCC